MTATNEWNYFSDHRSFVELLINKYAIDQSKMPDNRQKKAAKNAAYIDCTSHA